MRCPKCGQSELNLAAPCEQCQFSGEPALLEKLVGLNFLLAEAKGWTTVAQPTREGLLLGYNRQKRQVEVALGLRPPPLEGEAARAARLEAAKLNNLWYVAIGDWERRGWITTVTARSLKVETGRQLNALLERLGDSPADLPAHVQGYHQLRLVHLRYQLERLTQLQAAGRLARPAVYEQATAILNSDIEQLEIKLGLRPKAVKTGRESQEAKSEERGAGESGTRGNLPSQGRGQELRGTDEGQVTLAATASPTVVVRPVRKRPPLTWDLFWESLLSERTLQAILFLGAGLLFAAAISLVIWNWETFPPWLQVTFLVSFTAAFYGLGWYVRGRLKLRRGGIALSAVASLLAPLDFFAFYRSGGFPEAYWAEVWLLASAVCLFAYLLTTYLIQAEFFGYLVAVAAGSLLAAGMQVAGVPVGWWQAGLAGLALLLALVAQGSERRKQWAVLSQPFWQVALLAMATILVLATSYGWLGRLVGYPDRHGLAADWWFGGLLFALAAGRYRQQWFAVAAVVAFPLATWLTQQSLYHFLGLDAAWHALGWALLAPLYLGAAELLEGRAAGDEFYRSWRRMALIGCGLLAALAFGWSLVDTAVISLVHPILALTALAAAWRWQRPALLSVVSFLLLTATFGWLRGSTPGQLGLAWALLAILHVALAFRLARRWNDAESWQAAPAIVFRSGWLLAGLAVLPPLLSLDRPALTYAVGNWVAINGWLALLVHENVLRISY